MLTIAKGGGLRYTNVSIGPTGFLLTPKVSTTEPKVSRSNRDGCTWQRPIKTQGKSNFHSARL
jgi:hypothetical protein